MTKQSLTLIRSPSEASALSVSMADPAKTLSTRSMLLLMICVACISACNVSEESANALRVAVQKDIAPAQEESFDSSSIADFAGSWEAVSDDGTNAETAEFEITDGVANGLLRTLERGYYSGQVKVTAEVVVRGSLRNGALDLTVVDHESGALVPGVKGRAIRRGEYLDVRIGNGQSSYARPGVSLVRSAEGSTAAEKIAGAVAGRIFSSSSQAAERGAFVGSRVRVALCSDGTIAFDVSDVATTGGADGVDMGSSTSRRGNWDVVLLAGLPAVRAHWNGTGSSYSLTRYFRIQPNADGSSALIDGTELPVTGSC